MLVGLGILLVAMACGAVARYARFGACRGGVAEAERLLAAAGAFPARDDLTAHLRYLRQRLDKGWLYAKRDVFLGRLSRETRQVLRAVRERLDAPHRRPGHHVIVTVSQRFG